MTPECEALKERLERAEQAYEDLQTGKAVRVLVDQSGERVEFTTANHYRLATYIEQLRNRLATECGVGSKTTGPLRFFF